MADDAARRDRNRTAGAPRDPRSQQGDEPTIDMTPFEQQFRGPALDREPVLPPAHDPQPRVEWAVAWADGRLTPVSGESAARFLAHHRPGCLPVCRLVGPWSHERLGS